MRLEIVVPSVGESVSKGTLSSWLKGNGETVVEGENLFELETDKATLAVPSPASGVLSIGIAQGGEVTVGQVVAHIDTEEVQVSPAVRRLVAEHQLRPSSIEGTGKDGRITKKDVVREVERLQTDGAVKEGVLPAAETTTKPEGLKRVPGERLTRRVKMSAIRKRTAEKMVMARQNAAHLTTFNEVNMARVSELRRSYGQIFEEKHGVRLGLMSFFVKACCEALKAYPEVNAQVDGDDIIYNDEYDIGVAVSTERGLLVPVVRNADRLSFAEIERAIRSFGERAREKRLSPDELVGGTFTITNGGVFGSLLSTPIPNPPQTAILGMHVIQNRPVALGDRIAGDPVAGDHIAIQPMMYVALTYDHRIIDGREAVGFLVKVKKLVEDPQRLLLDL